MSQPGNKLPLTFADDEERARFLKALAHPVRLAILQLLHHGPCCATIPVIKLGLPQPTLSKHLQLLKEAGIINYRLQGTQHCYFICRPALVGPLLDMLEKTYPYQPCSKPEQHLS